MKDYALYIFDWEGTITKGTSFGLSDNIVDLLKRLQTKGKKIAVATGGRRSSFDMVLEVYELKDFFIYTRTCDECPPKPEPQMIYDILEFNSVKMEEAVMIGDTVNDMLMAQRAGIDRIAVCQGFDSRQELEMQSPNFVFSSIKELYENMVL